MLSYLKKVKPYDIAVFAMDVDTDLNSVRLIKDIYNITEVPTLIINRHAYSGMRDLDAIELVLNRTIQDIRDIE